MGNRISKVTTTTGDDGTTGLANGDRISKSDIRMEVIGDIDELNSVLGLMLAELGSTDSLYDICIRIQHDLFDLGGQLAMPGQDFFQIAALEELESDSDRLNQALPPLKDFILPGGDQKTAWAHLARTVCRRAERHMVRLSNQDQDPKHKLAVQYLNRLSDFLFIAARTLSKRDDGIEVLWSSRSKK